LKEIASQGGSDESARMYVYVTIHSGNAEVIIEKTVTQRMPIQDYEKAMDLYERLTCGNGRKVFTLEELAHK